MKRNIGDRVRIKSYDWYKENKDTDGKVWTSGGQIPFDKCMSEWCGKVMTISHVRVDHYTMVEDLVGYWSDEMIEGLVEEENLIERVDDNGLPFNEWLSHKGFFYVPDGYELKDENGNVINATKIVLEKKPDDKLKLESTKKVREYWSEYARIYIEIYDNEPNECVLTHLYTLEGHRQKGYGRQALIEAELIAKELGCHTAYLKVETNSWMHEWYLRMGYKWYKTADKEYTWLVKNLTCCNGSN